MMEEVAIPKTYSTRKGALLLFSEDLAQKHSNARRRKNHGGRLSQSVDGNHLKTVEDLAKSILAYGSNVSFILFSFHI